PIRLLEDFEVADVVRGPGVRNAGTGALGLDAEHAVFQTTAAAVPDQRDFALRVGGQLVVITPGRHPEGDIFGIQRQPAVPVLVVQKAGFAVQKLPDPIVGNAHYAPSTWI